MTTYLRTQGYDLVARIRREQAYLAEVFSDRMFCELRPHIRSRDFKKLEGWVDWDLDKMKGHDYNDKLLSTHLRNEMGENTYEAIEGYTNWLVFVYFSHGINGQKLPAVIDFAKISEKYGVPLKLLERTTQMLHAQKKLPLIGKVQDGYIIPDKKKIEEYKTCFDWGVQN